MNQPGNDEIRDQSISMNKLTQDVQDSIDPYVSPTSTVANNYVCTIPKYKTLSKGIGLYLEINVANTDNCTLNLNEWGAKPILDSLGNQINVNGLKVGIPYHMKYNGSAFILQGKGGGGNLTSADLRKDKTATGDNGPVIGTMPENGSPNIISGKDPITLAPGYYSGGTINSPAEYIEQKDMASKYNGPIIEYFERINGDYNTTSGGIFEAGCAPAGIYNNKLYYVKANNVDTEKVYIISYDLITKQLLTYNFAYPYYADAFGGGYIYNGIIYMTGLVPRQLYSFNISTGQFSLYKDLSSYKNPDTTYSFDSDVVNHKQMFFYENKLYCIGTSVSGGLNWYNLETGEVHIDSSSPITNLGTNYNVLSVMGYNEYIYIIASDDNNTTDTVYNRGNICIYAVDINTLTAVLLYKKLFPKIYDLTFRYIYNNKITIRPSVDCGDEDIYQNMEPLILDTTSNTISRSYEIPHFFPNRLETIYQDKLYSLFYYDRLYDPSESKLLRDVILLIRELK